MNDFSELFKVIDSALRPPPTADDIPRMLLIVGVMLLLSFLLAYIQEVFKDVSHKEEHHPTEMEPMQWPHLMEIPLDEREFMEKPKNDLMEVVGIGDDGELLYADEKPKNEVEG